MSTLPLEYLGNGMRKKKGGKILSTLPLMLITKIKDLYCLIGWLAVAPGEPVCLCVFVSV